MDNSSFTNNDANGARVAPVPDPAALNTYLLKANEVTAAKMLPVTVLLWLYLIVGLLGNGLVMLVYWAKKKPVREDRYCIPFLALVDLSSCVVSAGFGIYAHMYPLMFRNDSTCKAAAFLGIFLAGFSADMLVLIAVERYLKLCRPFGRQLTIFAKKVAMMVILLTSLLVAVPSVNVYGAQRIMVKGKIPAWVCMDVKDNEHVIGHLVYKIILILLTFLRFLAFLICYGNVIKTIVRQGKHRLRMTSISGTSSTVTNSNVEECEMNRNPNGEAGNPEVEERNKARNGNTSTDPCLGHKQDNQTAWERLSSKRKQSLASVSGSIGRRGSARDQQGIRLTVIFILITFIYVVTFGPKVGLMIAGTLNKDVQSTMPMALFRFLHTFYIFNNIVNPIVYAAMDRRFRTDCKKRFTKCR